MTAKSFKIMLAIVAVIGIGVGLSTQLVVTKVPPLVWSVEKLVLIGRACKAYADQHDGKYPSDWSHLAKDLEPEVFRLGRNKANLGEMTNVMAWTDFVYMTGLTTASPSNAVLAFLPPGHYPKDNRGLMLFADLHVESVPPDQFTRKMSESQQAIRQANLPYKGRGSDLAWVSRDMAKHPDALIDWVTVTIRKGTNVPYWSFGGGKSLNQPNFEHILEKLEQYGAGELFLYAEDEVTVRQVELTLDILRSHSVTNILMFTRVQGVIAPPFEMPEGLKLDLEDEGTNSPLRSKF
jgi:hypothetical protein